MLRRRTLKAYAIAIVGIFSYSLAAALVCVAIPGDTTRSGSDEPRQVTIGFSR